MRIVLTVTRDNLRLEADYRRDGSEEDQAFAMLRLGFDTWQILRQHGIDGRIHIRLGADEDGTKEGPDHGGQG